MTAKKKIRERAAPSLAPRWRVRCGEVMALGPGKADLLAAIAAQGSLARAAKAMEMSYMRAWLLVQEMHRCFAQPLVQMERGGVQGGGATLTAEGQMVLALYRRMEERARKAAEEDWELLRKLLRERPQAALKKSGGRRAGKEKIVGK